MSKSFIFAIALVFTQTGFSAETCSNQLKSLGTLMMNLGVQTQISALSEADLEHLNSDQNENLTELRGNFEVEISSFQESCITKHPRCGRVAKNFLQTKYEHGVYTTKDMVYGKKTRKSRVIANNEINQQRHIGLTKESKVSLDVFKHCTQEARFKK